MTLLALLIVRAILEWVESQPKGDIDKKVLDDVDEKWNAAKTKFLKE